MYVKVGMSDISWAITFEQIHLQPYYAQLEEKKDEDGDDKNRNAH